MNDGRGTYHHDSKCYFVQLQIDSFLDGDLSDAQRDEFMSHVQGCGACGAELRFAQTVQNTIMDLPILDCTEQALEPIHRLGRREAGDTGGTGFRFMDWFGGWPVLLRYAMPPVLIAALALAVIFIGLRWPQPVTAPATAAREAPAYDPAEIMQAIEDLNIAIDYLSEISERTEAMIGARLLMTPLQDSLNASFENIRNTRLGGPPDDPI